MLSTKCSGNIAYHQSHNNNQSHQGYDGRDHNVLVESPSWHKWREDCLWNSGRRLSRRIRCYVVLLKLLVSIVPLLRTGSGVPVAGFNGRDGNSLGFDTGMWIRKRILGLEVAGSYSLGCARLEFIILKLGISRSARWRSECRIHSAVRCRNIRIRL